MASVLILCRLTFEQHHCAEVYVAFFFNKQVENQKEKSNYFQKFVVH